MNKPKFIYKYQSISNYSLGNLKDSKIYFNNPKDFNDPFDTFQDVKIVSMSNKGMKDIFFGKSKERLIFELLEKEIASFSETNEIFMLLSSAMKNFKFDLFKELGLETKIVDKLSATDIKKLINLKSNLQNKICKSFYSTVGQIINDSVNFVRGNGAFDVGISCFSEKKDIMLMWSHYTGGHKGFCLEFDTSYAPFTKTYPIKYSKEIPKLYTENLNKNSKNLTFMNPYILSKYIDWSYEKEWRILHKESRTSFFYNKRALNSVYFGVKISKPDLEIVVSIIKDHYPNCKFFKMKKIIGTFKVLPFEVYL